MTEKKHYDVIVIGGGPAGYVAAIRCAQLGLKTACVDAFERGGQPSLGGTCLNVGCIPSKALIESSELYQRAREELPAHGIKPEGLKLDLKAMLARKDKVVAELTEGVHSLFQANKVAFIHGRATLEANREVAVKAKDGDRRLSAANVIIATGSSPAEFAPAPFTEGHIVDSTGALGFTQVPKRLAVIGAGVIGLELGSVWRRLGSEVIMLKSSDTFLPQADAQVAAEALRRFQAQGLDIRMGARVEGCTVKRNKVELRYADKDGDHQERVDKVIVAVGRTPNSAGVLAEDSGVGTDRRGFIEVDEQCRTGIDGVWAIGDVVRGPMLAHKGSEEGMMVAELIAGRHAQVDLETVPAVVYTRPEIAWVGRTEQQLKEAGIAYHDGHFPFAANGRARAMGETGGFIKVLADARTDRILGVHMIGPHCSELIAQAKIAMELGASSEDLALTMFAHPTLAETLHEAALSVERRAIHAVQAKRRG